MSTDPIQDDKAAWIREVKEAWRPFWTPEMEQVYAPEVKRERGERRRTETDVA